MSSTKAIPNSTPKRRTSPFAAMIAPPICAPTMPAAEVNAPRTPKKRPLTRLGMTLFIICV